MMSGKLTSATRLVEFLIAFVGLVTAGIGLTHLLTKDDQNEAKSLPVLGAYFSPVPEEEASSIGVDRGAYVLQVDADGPADRGGMRSGDVLLQIESNKVEIFSDVPSIVSRYRGGETISVLLNRNGKLRTIKIKLGSKNLQ